MRYSIGHGRSWDIITGSTAVVDRIFLQFTIYSGDQLVQRNAWVPIYLQSPHIRSAASSFSRLD